MNCSLKGTCTVVTADSAHGDHTRTVGQGPQGGPAVTVLFSLGKDFSTIHPVQRAERARAVIKSVQAASEACMDDILAEFHLSGPSKSQLKQ